MIFDQTSHPPVFFSLHPSFPLSQTLNDIEQRGTNNTCPLPNPGWLRGKKRGRKRTEKGTQLFGPASFVPAEVAVVGRADDGKKKTIKGRR